MEIENSDETSAFICPRCQARLPLSMTLRNGPQSVDGPARLYLDLDKEEVEAVDRHAQACAGPDGPGPGESLPESRSA